MKQYSVVRGFLGVMTLILGLGSICWLTLPVVAGNTDKPDALAIMPTQSIQSFLNNMASTNNQQTSVNTEESIREKFEELRRMAGQDKDLVLQLLYFDAHARTERDRWLSMAVVKYLAISNETFAEVGLSLLDAEDEATRKQAFGCLTRADRTSKGEIDFSRYEGILREKKQHPQQGLIRYMYNRNPQAAVVTVARVYSQDVPELEVVAKAKSGVKESVDYFAGRAEWWAHLYVAAMMEKEPYLRTPELVKKLEQDTDPLVREKVSKLKNEMKPK